MTRNTVLPNQITSFTCLRIYKNWEWNIWFFRKHRSIQYFFPILLKNKKYIYILSNHLSKFFQCNLWISQRIKSFNGRITEELWALLCTYKHSFKHSIYKNYEWIKFLIFEMKQLNFTNYEYIDWILYFRQDKLYWKSSLENKAYYCKKRGNAAWNNLILKILNDIL